MNKKVKIKSNYKREDQKLLIGRGDIKRKLERIL